MQVGQGEGEPRRDGRDRHVQPTVTSVLDRVRTQPFQKESWTTPATGLCFPPADRPPSSAAAPRCARPLDVESVIALPTCLLIGPKVLALVRLPAHRRLDGVARTLAPVYATLPTEGAAGHGGAAATTTPHEVLMLLAAMPDMPAASSG